jgi:TolB-like protein/Tfp pilus assembly protein PilF
MKRCPECRRDYFDDSLMYCLDDGSALLEGPAEPATAILSERIGAGASRKLSESPTESFHPTASEQPGEDIPIEPLSVPSNRSSVIAGIAGILLVTALGVGGYLYYGRGSAKEIESIAVMPFVNESGSADVEYLADGMTESLINSLSNLPNLSVKARNSVFRYKGTDEKKIGQDLSVQAVLLGRVTQRGDDITLYLSLVESQTGVTLWGEQYDRQIKNLSSLQKDITRDVSQKLRTRLSNVDAKNLTKNYTENAEAYRLYLKGRYFWYRRTPDDLQKSSDYFQQAIELDPNYALAYSGLADYYGVSIVMGRLSPHETWFKQEALVRRALELDPNLAEAHNSFAGLKRYYYRDFAGAEKEFLRAFELDPDYAEAHTHYGGLLAFMGRFDEGLIELKRGVELEPLTPNINFRLARGYYFAGRYDEAIEQSKKTIELDANSFQAHELLSNLYEQKGMYDQSISELRTALTLTKNSALATILENTFNDSGFDAAVRTVTQKRLGQLNEEVRRGAFVPAGEFARLYVRLGDRSNAFLWLEKVVEERNVHAIQLKVDPAFRDLRDDPRFREILRKAGFPD